MITIDTEGKQEIFDFLRFLREEGSMNMMHGPRMINIRFGIDLPDAEDLFWQWAENPDDE